MANWSNLKSSVASVIKTNENNEITGQALQDVLNSIISNLGANAQFVGVATPETTPGIPDNDVFYLAGKAGVYINFSQISIENGEVAVLVWNGSSWTKKNIYSIADGSITKDKIADGAVTYDKIADKAVSKDKLDEDLFKQIIELISFKGVVNLESKSNIDSIANTLDEGQVALCIIGDSNGNYPSSTIRVNVSSELTISTNYFFSTDARGANVGDILLIYKATYILVSRIVLKIIPMNDAKSPTSDYAGTEGVVTVWDKTQINKISGIESVANAALPRSSQLPSISTNNMNNALQTGVYPWCTLGRPANSQGAYTCIVIRTSTNDGEYDTIEQTAYGRQNELGQVYKRIIFYKSDGSDTQYGSWIKIGDKKPRGILNKFYEVVGGSSLAYLKLVGDSIPSSISSYIILYISGDANAGFGVFAAIDSDYWINHKDSVNPKNAYLVFPDSELYNRGDSPITAREDQLYLGTTDNKIYQYTYVDEIGVEASSSFNPIN